MGETSIEWTDFTWNPWHGCHKVSAGCKFCYMFRDKNRWNQDGGIVMRSGDAVFNKPLKIKEPKRIFTCSWSDFFIEDADHWWRERAWEIIRKTPHLTYQILTKRPERIRENLPADWGSGYPNVWLGVSCENQDTANFRVPILCEIPARIRFVSAEPLLGPIDFYKIADHEPRFVYEKIHWIIVGGESGAINPKPGGYGARECKPEWIAEIVRYCGLFFVPVFIKQLGTVATKTGPLKYIDWTGDPHGRNLNRTGLEVFNRREFPDTK